MGGVGVGPPVYPLPATVKVVEAMILLVNDNNVADLREFTVAGAVVCVGRRVPCHRLRATRNCHDRQNNGDKNFEWVITSSLKSIRVIR